MGLFDTIIAKCPNCCESLQFQTKSGDCILANFKLENAPKDALRDANRHAPIKCQCGVYYAIDIENKSVIAVKK